jgi:hypothetical protein
VSPGIVRRSSILRNSIGAVGTRKTIDENLIRPQDALDRTGDLPGFVEVMM